MNRSGFGPLIFWGLLGLAVVVAPVPASGDLSGHQAAISLIAGLFGVWAFYTHGRQQVTAAGVYCLASAFFVGYAGWWWAGKAPNPEAMFTATCAAYFTTLFAYCLFWHRAGGQRVEFGHVTGAAGSAGWGRNVGVVLVAAAVVLTLTGAPTLVYSAVAFAGTALLVVGMAVRPRNQSFTLGQLVVVAAVVLLYVTTMFSGYGRLSVVALVVLPAIVLAQRLHGRSMKLVVIAGGPVVTTALGVIRQERVTATYGHVSSSVNSADSTTSPLLRFSDLIAGIVPYTHGHGDTFWASLTVFVPRNMWEDKPDGFGAVLAQIFNPALVPYGHSDAALTQGEWFYNFGWLGLVAMVPVIGLLIRGLDQLLAHGLAADFDTRRAVLGLATIAIIVAGLPDLVWNGSNTYITRTGFRLLPLLAIYLAFGWRSASTTGSRSRWTTYPPRSLT